MMNRRFLFAVIVAVFLASCAEDPNSKARKPGSNDDQKPSASVIEGLWKITSKTCNGSPASFHQDGTYKIDTSFIAEIFKSEEDSSHVCLTALVFERVINSWDIQSDNAYEETGVLRAANSRVVCRHKQGGRAVEPPYRDEQQQFTAEELNARINATRDSMTVQLRGSSSCSYGVLTLRLKRLEQQ